MTRTFIASAALALTIPALSVPAFAEPAAQTAVAQTAATQPIAFSHDGVEYLYTVSYKADGRRVMEGTANGAPFKLVASKRRVMGTVQNRAVSFGLAEVKALTVRERLATR